MKTETDPQMLAVGKAVVEITKTWPVTIVLMAIFFPIYAKRMMLLTRAMVTPLENGRFGTDEELGLKTYDRPLPQSRPMRTR